MDERKTVTVGKKDCAGRDEILGAWFRCPKCKSAYFTLEHESCPHCDVPFRFTRAATRL